MQPRPATVLVVYRRRNARHVARLLRSVPTDWRVGLWALDAIAHRLARHTMGTGPGAKFDLINQLYAKATPPMDHDVVVADDDVVFERGGLRELLEVSHAAGLSLSMPAHGAGSPHSFGITRAVPGSRARLTTFVEIGPLFAVRAEDRQAFLPFPKDIGMGWGLELTWHDLSRRGYRLGVIDEFPVQHRGRVAAAYDDAPERERLARLFAARGISSWEPVQQTLGTWSRDQPTAPWLAS
jgi:hypothetical protein